MKILTKSTDENINAQIIFSSSEEKPTLENAEQYAWKYFGDVSLHLNSAYLKEKIYLSLTFNKYPCSFSLILKEEKNWAILDINDSYSYINNKIKAK